jgi:hypothetical protein
MNRAITDRCSDAQTLVAGQSCGVGSKFKPGQLQRAIA